MERKPKEYVYICTNFFTQLFFYTTFCTGDFNGEGPSYFNHKAVIQTSEEDSGFIFLTQTNVEY